MERKPLHKLQRGETAIVPVVELINLPYSIDYPEEHGHEFDWFSQAMTEKTQDEYYEELKGVLEEEGFTTPVTVAVSYTGVLYYGDGHHRLCAAFELGVAEIPVYFPSKDNDVISEDSGCWAPTTEQWQKLQQKRALQATFA